ncbi:Trigger factor, partial [human gut metagenome]
IGSQIQVPGFRRGHVPNRVIDQRVGRGSVIQEAVNNKLSDFYREAMTEAGRVPMLQPEIEITELPNV